jgi:hypothetical protein
MKSANPVASTVLLAAALALTGCVATPVYTVQEVTKAPACITPALSTGDDVLIGLSVSGGGSRAALFAAGGMEALGKLRVGPEKRSLLEQVSYISSVSGGSLASAYYVVKKPKRITPVLYPNGEMTDMYKDFFKGFKQTVGQDYEKPLLWHQLLRFRSPTNSALTAKSLSEILREQYFGDMTFGGLARRETRGDSPYLMINTTLYNDGRRFIFSTLPKDAAQYNPMPDLNRNRPPQPQDEETDRMLKIRWNDLQSRTPDDLNIDICPIRVAAAVTASMSFPPIIGPISFRVGEKDLYWHVGDGGLSDNSGAESLLMVFLKKLQEGKAKKALVIALDSSFPFSVGGEVLNNRTEGFTMFSYDFSRIPSIMEERSLAYRSLFFRVAQRQGILPDQKRLGIVILKHTDAKWKEDLSDLPESCQDEKVDWKSPKDVSRHLSGVVTRLWIESTCDRDLVLTAASKVVAQNEDKIRKFLKN